VPIILLILGFVISSNSIYASDYITVNGRAIKLTSSTKCTEIDTSKAQDICDCCLLKYASARGESNERALAICQNKNLCDAEPTRPAPLVIEDARRNLAPFELVDVLALTGAPRMPQDGLLNEESVLGIITTLTDNNFLPLFMKDLFAKSTYLSCFKIKALGGQSKGVHTGQLFSISVNGSCFPASENNKKFSGWHPLYILKESKKGYSELRNLYQVKASILGQEYVPTALTLYEPEKTQEDGQARITFEEVHFKLESSGHTRYFSLLQTAKGTSLQEQLQEFGTKITQEDISTTELISEIDQAKKMFYRVGYSMSKLHQKYAIKKIGSKNLGKTYIHGDFHAQNVFYEQASGQVTLIDNETFSLSLKKRTSGVNDIVDLYLLHTVKTVAHMVSKQLLTNRRMGINDTIWHELWHDLFLGYITAYDFPDKKSLRAAYYEFRAKFFEALSNKKPFDSLKNFKDQRVLKRIGPSWRRFYTREVELNRAFIQLKKSLKI